MNPQLLLVVSNKTSVHSGGNHPQVCCSGSEGLGNGGVKTGNHNSAPQLFPWCSLKGPLLSHAPILPYLIFSRNRIVRDL